ncbi:HAD hydrolase-like protein [Domibacillus sp. 8LH]|uniref:HAD hydrolase-like protein n=1 Tax=Domibacillus TaxID=1433999 RepID=UPI00203A9658|nr:MULTISPECIES: HAD hydrolase-like protein [Domibacillus]MCM3789499.1 HAD hydrolase-like protein [Domibacillus indicus]WNS79334.1 HAD hydrolase-like protein [Domibacillus sp. DTU_2020_1001157_1_SI_ALB_TIR_016]
MTKCIIFDFDGTLSDSIQIFIKAYNDFAEKEGYNQVSIEELDDLKKMSIPERCRHLNFPMRSIPFAAPKLYRFIRESKASLPLFPGIKQMLDELSSRGIHIAIISSNASDIINHCLKSNGIHYIHDIFSSKYIFSKDKMIKKLLKQYNYSREEVFYVGDEQRDIDACMKSGLRAVWASWGYDHESLISGEASKAAVPDDIVDFALRT